MKSCKGCPTLEFELWPKGAAVYICTSPDKPEHLGRRRVIDYRSLANRPRLPPAQPGARKGRPDAHNRPVEVQFETMEALKDGKGD